jgi:hypothetical protein
LHAGADQIVSVGRRLAAENPQQTDAKCDKDGGGEQRAEHRS